jgi:peptidoglycan/LPS O-acetylase OafA/YrhL
MAALIFTQLYLGYGCLVLAAVFIPADRRFGPIARLVALIGFYSYGIYIWHNDTTRPVLLWLCGEGGFLLGLSPTIRWALVYTLFTGSSFLLAWLSYRWIERPALALRDRWCPGRTRSAIGTPAADAVSPRQLIEPEVKVVQAVVVRGILISAAPGGHLRAPSVTEFR